jgi:hypothetical protein
VKRENSADDETHCTSGSERHGIGLFWPERLVRRLPNWARMARDRALFHRRARIDVLTVYALESVSTLSS